MPDWLDSPQDVGVIVAITVGLFTILGSLLGGAMWVLRAQVQKVLHELQPNSGKSMRDALNRVEARVGAIDDKLDGHIQWHLERSVT